jgi:uncharacterized membrane protein YfcA
MSVIIHLLIMQKSSQLLQLSFALWGGARGKNQLILASAEKLIIFISNFMIRVTAAASAGVYLARGYIDPGLSMPVMLGVLPGAFLGARVLVGAQTQILRTIFSFVLVVMAFKMVYNSLTGGQ